MAIIYSEPFRAFRFLVEVENLNAADEKPMIAAAFSKFSGIRMRVDTIEKRSGSEPRGTLDVYTGLTHYENVTLAQGIVGDNDFMEWLYAAAPTEVAAPTGKNKYRTINIVALDERGNRGITWTLYNAVPVSYELSPFDGSQSELLSETMEFAYGGFKRTVSEIAADTKNSVYNNHTAGSVLH